MHTPFQFTLPHSARYRPVRHELAGKIEVIRPSYQDERITILLSKYALLESISVLLRTESVYSGNLVSEYLHVDNLRVDKHNKEPISRLIFVWCL